MNETEQLHGAASRCSEMKILIIDDELANVALLEDILSDSGYTQVKSIMAPRLTMQNLRRVRTGCRAARFAHAAYGRLR
jgi:CheY-like chemotaxis protein